MSLFEQILNTNIINFIIMISLLALIFKKANLASVIEKMASDIKSKVEKSSFDTKNAIDEYKRIKKEVKNTPKLKEEIHQNAIKTSDEIKQKINKKTLETTLDLKKGLDNIYLNQKIKQKNLTLKEVYYACVDLAKDETLKILDENMQKKLIDNSIDELNKIEKE